MSDLEARYRRLLRWYPAEHRHRHQDEMLGVLLATAEPGRRRPAPRDTADLLTGAARLRGQRLLRGLGRGWPDGLALVAVVAPMLLLAQQLAYLTAVIGMSGGEWSVDTLFLGAGGLLLAGAIVALTWRGRRRPAMGTAWALVVYVIAQQAHFWGPTLVTGGDTNMGTRTYLAQTYADMLVAVLCAAALTIPGTLARGRELAGHGRLGRFGCAMSVALTLALLTPAITVPDLLLLPFCLTIVAFWAGRALGSPAAVRAAALLALPVAAGTAVGLPTVLMNFVPPLGPVFAFGPGAVVFAATAVHTVRSARREDAADSASPLPA